SRDIHFYGGLVGRMPLYAVFLMLFTFASIGLPGTSGFVGEFLILLGTFQKDAGVAALAALAVILGACYMLWLYRKLVFGVMHNQALATIKDLDLREIIVFLPLAVLTLWMGIYPKPFVKVLEPAAQRILAEYKTDLEYYKDWKPKEIK